MSIDLLKINSNFFKDDDIVDSSKGMSYVQITRMVDKTILTVDYEAKTSKRITIGDIGKVLLTQMRISNDEVLGITTYFFGQDKGFV